MADYCVVEAGEEAQIFAELARSLLASVQGLAVAVVAAAVATGSVRVLEKVVVERH